MKIGNVVMQVWTEKGVQIERVDESPALLQVWISVPEHSWCKAADGNEMAGDYLARRFKTVMTEMGVKRLLLRARTRVGDNWTKEKGEAAVDHFRRDLYGSQH